LGGVDTLFSDIDDLTGGLHNSELIILAARPSMGKTALAMNIAEYVARKLGEPTLLVSLEMSGLELADRLLCSAAGVNGHRLRNGTISQAERQRLVRMAAEISQKPLYVDDSPSRTVSEIAAAARRIRRREQRLGLVIIDYLQLIEPDNPSDSRQEQVARITRRLKGLAREANVPVLVLAQLNRQAEDSKDHRPRLSHLRESGAIEQDADVVMFVHREEYYRHGSDKEQFEGLAQIIIAKQRNGPTGEVELVWEKEHTRFRNKAADYRDAPEPVPELVAYNEQEF
jgi:replicative DNA helicase